MPVLVPYIVEFCGMPLELRVHIRAKRNDRYPFFPGIAHQLFEQQFRKTAAFECRIHLGMKDRQSSVCHGQAHLADLYPVREDLYFPVDVICKNNFRIFHIAFSLSWLISFDTQCA